MKLLILGRGKTGSLVAEVAREHKHEVRVLGSANNVKASALTPASLSGVDVVIDFTSPHAVLENIAACVAAKKNVVVGTTGWHSELSRIREMVEKSGTGLLYAANFSIGVNLFYETVRTAAAALRHDYFGQIFERHHAHKKDAPSGTAIALQGIIKESSGIDVEIVSFREGEVVGMHEVVFDSAADSIYLCHDAKSRRGFAEGAVRGAEWLAGKSGFFDFKDIWREL
ncbi:MAG TPA: dihydrodipicolinate reductase C-terminal domain-containing protein [Terriglobales bacterium]|jgi:4-hydroxy-tetrahydrodipicolinate reductase|nr:dihydrodipicolinate reductase C-terminal domain-containing protein [Terriglobales bacterium]